MIPFPAIGRIKAASKQAAANPIRFPERLAITAHTAIAMIIAKNRIPKASLTQAAPSCENIILYNIDNLSFFMGRVKGFDHVTFSGV